MNAPQGGAAPSPKAQGTASAALALLSRSGKAGATAGKTPGKTGLSAALEHVSSKGGTSFLELIKAKAAGSAPAAGGDLAAALKNAVRKAAGAPGASVGAAAESVLQEGTPSSLAAHAAKVLGQDEKTGKKKAAHSADGQAQAAALALAPSDGGKLLKSPAPVENADLKAAAAASHAAAQKTAEPVIRVVDLRTRARAAAPVDDAGAKLAAAAGTNDKDAAQGTFVQKLAAASAPAGADKAAAPAAAAPLPGDTPLDRLREAAGAELVRASNLVLRDGGGEIRLVLKPESLGSVRIRMNVIDNAIEGKIVVDSSSVKQVMDANLDALRRALTAEGFQMGSLQVSVGGQDANPRQQQQDQQPAEAVRRVAAAGFDQAVPGAESLSLGDLFVNLFV